ncbi:hypothetical protein C7M84_021569 [Penaeus vannamei]|uniref:Uncharacterized protein n=1 Tax=Penaeus vannamei TaxID=6689 RepID=A0A423U8K9_PENVA|nr:hypothetical protein C7M84_021569 [Penaeus vannamei]
MCALRWSSRSAFYVTVIFLGAVLSLGEGSRENLLNPDDVLKIELDHLYVEFEQLWGAFGSEQTSQELHKTADGSTIDSERHIYRDFNTTSDNVHKSETPAATDVPVRRTPRGSPPNIFRRKKVPKRCMGSGAASVFSGGNALNYMSFLVTINIMPPGRRKRRSRTIDVAAWVMTSRDMCPAPPSDGLVDAVNFLEKALTGKFKSLAMQ